MNQQTSKKTGLKSSAVKEANTRYGLGPMPVTQHKPGAFGKEPQSYAGKGNSSSQRQEPALEQRADLIDEEWSESLSELIEPIEPVRARPAEPTAADRNSEAKPPQALPEPDSETLRKQFTPTHGRSPEVIKEMLQSRRATDVVPDPEDVAAGRTGAFARREDAGLPAQAPAQPARPRPLTRNDVRNDVQAKATSKPKEAKTSAADERVKPTPARKSTKKAAAKTGGQQTGTRSSTQQAVAPKGSKQATSQKSVKKTPARKTASGNTKSRVTRKTSQTTTTKTRTTSSGRKSR